MHDCCQPPPSPHTPNKEYTRILAVALLINAAMFVVEIMASYASSALSLQADAIDFLGDAVNYASSLLVLASAPVWRSRLAFTKGIAMGAFGCYVLALAVYKFMHPVVPSALTIGAVGVLALCANVVVAWMLYRFRGGDSNQQSVWLCSRNDALGNGIVILSGICVYVWQSPLPDILAAVLIALFALKGAYRVLRLSLSELRRR